jgi:hypothetical protein
MLVVVFLELTQELHALFKSVVVEVFSLWNLTDLDLKVCSICGCMYSCSCTRVWGDSARAGHDWEDRDARVW